jgi:hypothetical protein
VASGEDKGQIETESLEMTGPEVLDAMQNHSDYRSTSKQEKAESRKTPVRLQQLATSGK